MTTGDARPTPMNELTAAERRALRARAHHLRPVIMIGNRALNPEVTLRVVAPSATAMIVGLQLIFSSFFLGVLGLRRE